MFEGELQLQTASESVHEFSSNFREVGNTLIRPHTNSAEEWRTDIESKVDSDAGLHWLFVFHLKVECRFVRTVH
jgi:hypothetical protein